MYTGFEIKAISRTIFDGYKGVTIGDITYRLACAASIIQAPNGDLLVWFLSGPDTEPTPDNDTLYMRSADGGLSWSKPRLIAPKTEENSAGAFSRVGDLLICEYYYWPWEKEYCVRRPPLRKFSRDSGHTWSQPEASVQAENGVYRYARPLPVSGEAVKRWYGYSERWGGIIRADGWADERVVPLRHNFRALTEARTEEEAAQAAEAPGEAESFPILDKFLTHHYYVGAVKDSLDLRYQERLGTIKNRPMGLLEPTMLETADGRFVMLMRAEGDGFLWRSESGDGGVTWRDAWRTDIPNPSTKPCLKRLRDGRIMLMHNATGKQGELSARNRLSIWLSDDELESFRVREDVIVESGAWLSYPSAVELEDGRILVVYDKWAWARRTVEFAEIKLPPR